VIAPRLFLAVMAGAVVSACATPPGEVLAWDAWEEVVTGASGEVTHDGEALVLGAGGPLTAVRWTGVTPTVPYVLEFEATRVRGNDFFCGLTFPAGDGHLTLVLGGWGGALCGLSCLDGEDAATNGTASYRGFALGRAYRVRLEVGAERVRAWLDEEPLLDVTLAGRTCSLRTEVAACAPLGMASYQTIARLGPLRLRRGSPERDG
jgi:hypothetical protein